MRLIRAEQAMSRAARAAMSKFLDAARAAILGDTTRADAGPADLPPNVDVWPDQAVWNDALATWIVPASGQIYSDGYWQAMPDGARDEPRLSDQDYVDAHMRDTTERLTGATWPDEVYEAVRREVADGRDQRESIPEVRKRIAKVLTLRHWAGSAEVISRTESIAALNAGHHQAGKRRQEVFGERLFKQWIATSDGRTRDTHRAANGTVVASDDLFVIGSSRLRYPHDPRGPASETVQCRCVLNWVDETEVDPEQIRDQQFDPIQTDNQGRPVVDTTDDLTATAAPEEVADTAAAADTSTPDDQPVVADGGPGWADAVIASTPELPPGEWFTDPGLDQYVRGIRITDEGRVFGHIAPWDVDHESMPGITAPRHGTAAAYAKFHRHPVMTADGGRVLTGPLATARLGEPKGHAELTVTLPDVMDHYDDPSFVAADVVAGEDEHGIWCAGALRPGVTPFQVHMLSRYSISGDWRNGELVAACSVTTPGFNKPSAEAIAAAAAGDPSGVGQRTALPFEDRPRAQVAADGHVSALVAAGIGHPGDPAPPPVDGWRLYREFRAAEAADKRITAARRRLSNPRALAAAARVRKEQ